MKNVFQMLSVLALVASVSTSAHAQFWRDRGGQGGPDRRDDPLSQCQIRSSDLERQVSALQYQMSGIQSENADLRRQLDVALGRGYEQTSFCYSACSDNYGNMDLTKLGAGEGRSDLEAGQNSVNATQAANSCPFKIKQVACEAVTTARQDNYCAAACSDNYGNIDTTKSLGSSGRNKTEAGFKAMQMVEKTYNCPFKVKVTNCQ